MKIISDRYIKTGNKNVYACFIDYEKSFGRVNHENMIKSLAQKGMVVKLFETNKESLVAVSFVSPRGFPI